MGPKDMFSFGRHLWCATCIFLGSGVATAGDWPQFLGPDRSGVSQETGLRLSWPREGPPVVWQCQIGEGFSAPAVQGDRLILLHRLEDKEVVDCLDAATGKTRWRYSYPTRYEDDFGKGNGPRATPVISGKQVFTLGAEGWLHCLDLESGHKIWGRSLNAHYDVARNFFGAGTTPLVEGNLLLVNVGGKEAGIVALARDTGREVWRATRDGASYASPVAATIDGQRYAIFFTRQGIVVLDPARGTVRFQTRWRSRSNASVNATSPVVIDDRIFFSASYETGGIMLRIGKDGFHTLWQNDDSLSSHYSNIVHEKGYLYGFDGRQELGARLRCIEAATGKVKWTQEGFGCGSTILVDGNLIVLTEKGDLVLVAASPNGYQERSRAHVFDSLPCRAHLALANGLLYGRDGSKLVCWNLRK
jgi:outer membrane protein assembly factor BamB